MTQEVQTAYIGLGSNLGDGLKTLLQAWQEIGRAEAVSTLALSSPYLSSPVAMESSNWFTNSVGMLETGLSPTQLLALLMEVESSFGRRREPGSGGYQDRTLDLDILYFGQTIIKNDTLTLPHPFLAQRLFVLKPLAELAPEFHDPVDGKTPVEKLQMLEQQMKNGEVPMQEISRATWR